MKGGCQLQEKDMHEGYSKYENVYARYTLSAKLRFLVQHKSTTAFSSFHKYTEL